mgnify:CR=1 FL=1
MVNYEQKEKEGYYDTIDKRSKEYKEYKQWKNEPKHTKEYLLWQDVKSRITSKMNRNDYKILCELHSELFKHKYYEPCTCSPKKIRQWIKEVDNRII